MVSPWIITTSGEGTRRPENSLTRVVLPEPEVPRTEIILATALDLLLEDGSSSVSVVVGYHNDLNLIAIVDPVGNDIRHRGMERV
jgi:hypothetical protein